MVYLERVDNDLESLANSGEGWKGRKMPGEMVLETHFYNLRC